MSEYAQRAERLVELYWEWILSSDRDAGWHQPSALQRMVEFKGQLPPPSGYDVADLKMIHELRYLREPHALLGLAKELLGRLSKREFAALIAECRYLGTINPETGKAWTQRRLAEELGLRYDQYRHHCKRGRQRMCRWLREIDEANGRAQQWRSQPQATTAGC
jgi:hypothetical protein